MRGACLAGLFLSTQLLPAVAVAQQDCVITSHALVDEACGAFTLNMCRRPIECTLAIEAFTAGGQRITETWLFALQHRETDTRAIDGIARCGTVDIRCLFSQPRRSP